MEEDYARKLQGLLRTLFQFDSTDLDFGIYRIMNQKRSEIEKFINEDLISAVNKELERYDVPHQTVLPYHPKIKKGLQVPTLDSFGASIGNETLVKHKTNNANEGKEEIEFEDNEVAFEQHKAEIFSHIYQFFSRYYDKGDFISLQRYSKQQKYAIPYNGEEVILYWANKDQYFIKTSKNFQNYTFRDDGNAYTIHFLISNAQVKNNNNKNENRYFILINRAEIETDNEVKIQEPIFYDSVSKELTIFFEYRGLTKEEEKKYGSRNVQDKILEVTEDKIFDSIIDSGLKYVLNKPVDENKNFLRKHLNRYVRANNTDYFIHKDLKGFLVRELDYYIKNEIFSLDDFLLESENEVKIALYTGRVRVLKTICLKIIDFLSQVEEFQKKLFEKKKFILTTEYCMTVDNVPENLYPEILKNKLQLAEWEKLYDIGISNQKSLSDFKSQAIDLKANPYLAVDTKFFDHFFKDRLVASFNDLDESTDGLLIKSENWQALNILLNKYAEKIKCIYIDPPYNTGNDEFLYKDSFQHSSWIAMMQSRLDIAKQLMSEDGSIFISIDDGEQATVRILQETIFGSNNFISNIIWQKKYSPQNDAKWFSDNHDFITCFAKNKDVWRPNLLERTEDQNKRYKNVDNDPRGPWKSSDLSVKTYSADYDYPISTPTGRIVNPPAGYCWRVSKERFKEMVEDNRIWFGNDGNNVPSIKRFLSEVKDGITPLTLWTYQEVGHNQEGKQELKAMLSSNEEVFGTPKVVRLLKRIITIGANPNSLIIDFFAGSGTTAHSILNLNKEDNGCRKYILVEMGEYVDTITKPRILKAIYSSEWKEGKPQSKEGQSHIFKYITLEQYEDTLNNIEFREKGSIQRRLDGFSDYILNYMLDFETTGSPCRLNVAKLTDPFSYTLKVSNGSEIHEQVVDLVETFNYLLGIHVKRIKTFENNGTYYRVIYGFNTQSKADKKENIIIVWRCTEGLDLKEDKEFIEGTILSEMGSASKIYINSDFAVEGSLPIEPTFSRLMGA